MRKPQLPLPALLALVMALGDHPATRPSAGGPPVALTSYATGQPAEGEGPTSYPSEWDWIRRAAPYWQVDEAAFAKAFQTARALREEASLAARASLLSLTPAGPDNIGGRIADIEWDPTDGNVAYAAAATGGVLKSTDGGLTWVSIGDALPNLNAGDLAVDPSAPQTVWLGTGEANGGHNNFPGRGVYRSTNDGADWEYPAMLKPRKGSGGWRNAIVHDDHEFFKWMENNSDLPFLSEEVVHGVPSSVCCLAKVHRPSLWRQTNRFSAEPGILRLVSPGL